MQITSTSAFLEYFESIRGRTRRVVTCIPPDRIEWTHASGRFTFGDLVRHLAATERWMFAENVAGRPSRYPGHGADLAQGYDGVIDYFDRMHAESVRSFARFRTKPCPRDARRRRACPCRPGSGSAP